jgi:hypothetical protein
MLMAMSVSVNSESALDKPARVIVELISHACGEGAAVHRIRGQAKVSIGKLLLLGSIAIVISSAIYFRGDLQRYMKIRAM